MADKKQAEDKKSEKNTTSTADQGKLKALGLAMEQIEKQFGNGAIMKLGESHRANVELISSGALSLDLALGGGYPKGRIIEIYGPESSGKTTLTLHAIAEVQRQGGTAAFIDAEHALDPVYAKKLGVDTSNLLISQPDNGEQALEIVETLVRSNAVERALEEERHARQQEEDDGPSQRDEGLLDAHGHTSSLRRLGIAGVLPVPARCAASHAIRPRRRPRAPARGASRPTAAGCTPGAA